MLLQILLNITVAIITFVVWVGVAFLAIPFGIYMFLMNNFPEFTLAYGFLFWAVLSILTIIDYYWLCFAMETHTLDCGWNSSFRCWTIIIVLGD